MRSRTTTWSECSVRYERQGENGMETKVTELYVVEALSFGDAEESITREMSSYVSGTFEVKNINPAAYGEIFFSDSPTDDKWYKTKLSFITIDEKTEKEKRTTVSFLVQASNFNGALKNIEEGMKSSLIDYVVANISETKIMDVFEINSGKAAVAAE